MRKSPAFTLIELLVVISIIALLSSVVLASLNSAREKGRLAAGKQFAANIYHAAADEAVAIWDFDEGTGTSVADRSGNGNALTLTNGPTWATDTPSGTGHSLALDGTNDYARAADSASLDVGTGDLTIVAWVKAQVTATQRIVSKRFGGIGLGYSLAVNSSGVPYVEILNNSSWIAASAPSSINDGRWHFVAAVIDRDGTGFACVDSACGTKANFAPMAADDLTNSLALDVGGIPVAGTGYISGNIDEVRVFTKSLTAMEVGTIYAADLGRNELAAQQ